VPSLAVSGNFVYAAVPSGFGIYRSTDNGMTWGVSLQNTVDYVEVAAFDYYAFAGSFFSGPLIGPLFFEFFMIQGLEY